MIKFVQFPHPKDEHGTQSPTIERSNIVYNGKKYFRWHVGAHARKFVLNEGSYIHYENKEDGVGKIITNEKIAFWCEWEAQSNYKELAINHGNLPNFINELFWDTVERLQNTDPFVFGDNFYWSFCRQNDQINLRKLDKGSLIIFGSGFGGNFVVDTVFVVKDFYDYKLSSFRNDLKNLDCETLKEITLEAGACGVVGSIDEPTYRLYVGANYSDRDDFDGMYSFIPCKPESKLEKNSLGSIIKGFERPKISFKKDGKDITVFDVCDKKEKLLINPSSNATQSAKTICFNDAETITKIWKSIRKQIRNQELFEGIFTKIPLKQNAPYKHELQKPILKYPFVNNLDEGVYKIAIKIVFQSYNQHGALIGNQNRDLNPNEYNSIIYIGTDGFLRATLWDGKSDRTLISKYRVDDGKIHTIIYFADTNKNEQLIYLDTKESIHDILNPEKENKIVKEKTIEYVIDKNNLHSKYFWQIGTAYSRNKPKTNGFWFTFDGLINEVIIKTNQNENHYKYPENK